MKIETQRLRNLTTGLLHTDMDCIYKDLEAITGEKGLMTHMLPRVCEAVKPWLKKNVTDERFWDDLFDISHTGEIELPDPTQEDRKEMFEIFMQLTDNQYKTKQPEMIIVQI